jgi:putative tryptophan/tyrosine transport system substrate-binding protein
MANRPTQHLPPGSVPADTQRVKESPGKVGRAAEGISPRVARAAVLFNPEIATFGHMFLPSMEPAARAAGLTLTVAAVRDGAEIEQAIAEAGREPDGGLIALPDSFLIAQRDLIVLAPTYREVRADLSWPSLASLNPQAWHVRMRAPGLACHTFMSFSQAWPKQSSSSR